MVGGNEVGGVRNVVHTYILGAKEPLAGREETTEGLLSWKVREELQTGGGHGAVEKCP